MEGNLHPFILENRKLRELPLEMKFSGGSLAAWQEKAREKLASLLGLPFETVPPEFTIEYVKETPAFTETRFTFQSERGSVVPCHFLRPAGATGTLPVMICLQGHSTGMHISLGRALYPGDEKDFDDGDRDFALQCVERGICAVTLEQRCFGERGGTPKPDCYSTAMTALLSGRTLLGGRVWDIMRLIDVLETDFADRIDPKKIWCCGNSGGGTATFYAAALEPRISGAMPSCAFCTFSGSIGAMYHCACNYVPQIRRYFDMAELAGMIAPRPLVIVSGAKDDIFPLQGAQAEFARAKNIYYLNSACPQNIRHVVGPEGHRFYAAQGWKAFFDLING